MATETQIEVVMPQMGVSVSEGTVTKWLKAEGEPIARDEALLEISTDKVDTEVPSPGEGVLAKIMVQEGETVEVGVVLAVIAPEGTEPAAAPEAPPENAVPPEPATQAAADASEAAASETAEPTPSTPDPAQAPTPARRPRRPLPARTTAARSSPRSWRGSPPSTASTSARCRAPGTAAG